VNPTNEYGPNSDAVYAYFELLPALSDAAWNRARDVAQKAAFARDSAWVAAWGAAERAVMVSRRTKEWDAAWDAARRATTRADRCAAAGACAIILRDVITPEQFNALAEPMRAAGVIFGAGSPELEPVHVPWSYRPTRSSLPTSSSRSTERMGRIKILSDFNDEDTKSAVLQGIRNLVALIAGYDPEGPAQIVLHVHPLTFAEIYKSPHYYGLGLGSNTPGPIREGPHHTLHNFLLERDRDVPEGILSVRFHNFETSIEIDERNRD
jgi:hypothetical protein